MESEAHDRLIQDQFTRQAIPFNTAAIIADERALAMIVAAGRPKPTDEVIDLACGGGLIACAFAPKARHVTGIDLTEAMLDRARVHAAEKGLANTDWRKGDVRALAFPDASFDIVATRFSFHHFQDPAGALREMARLCRPGGRVVLVDMYASEDPAKAAAWNRLEVMRDPSHVRALSLSELRALFPSAGLPAPDVTFYEQHSDVASLLARSFPREGDAEKITALFAAQAEHDTLGIPVRREGDKLHYTYRVAILAAVKQ